jgi:phosphoglycolate phosphatase
MKRFDSIECGASIFGKAKKIARIVKKAGVAPRQAIYIGDQSADGDAARQAKVAFGAVAWGYATAESLRECSPEYVFGRMEDLMRIAHGSGAVQETLP